MFLQNIGMGVYTKDQTLERYIDIVNKMIGATREPWYELKGKDLIEYMRVKRKMIKDVVLEELS